MSLPVFTPVDPVITGIIMGLVWGITQAIKRGWSLSGRATVAVAAICGVLLGAIAIAWQPEVTLQAVLVCLVSGLFGGLGAIGIDVGARAVTGKVV